MTRGEFRSIFPILRRLQIKSDLWQVSWLVSCFQTFPPVGSGTCSMKTNNETYSCGDSLGIAPKFPIKLEITLRLLLAPQTVAKVEVFLNSEKEFVKVLFLSLLSEINIQNLKCMFKQIINDSERIFIIILCLIITFLINFFIQKIVFRGIIKEISEKSDITRINFFKHLATTTIWVIGIGLALSFIPQLNTIGHTLLAGAGLASLVVSLSSQQALSNIVSGILLIIYKPFKINDTIKFGEIIGRVDDIDLRQTTLIDKDGNMVIIPNSVIGNQTITKIVENKKSSQN